MSTPDWKPYDVPGLVALLAEQPTDSGTHAMAWQQAYETLTDQRQRIEAARTALTAAWPATPGSAAGSFFDEVDALTQAMGATAETSVSVHGALTGIVTAVDGATAKVDTLHQSWQQNQATIGDAVPTEDWTQPLNDQAHTVMGQADAAIAEHATQLVPPVPYSPGPPVQTYTPIQAPTAGKLGGGRSGMTTESNGYTMSAGPTASPHGVVKVLQPDATSPNNGEVVMTSDPAAENAPLQGLTTRSPISSITPGDPNEQVGTHSVPDALNVASGLRAATPGLNRGETKVGSTEPKGWQQRIETGPIELTPSGQPGMKPSTSGATGYEGAGAVDTSASSTLHAVDQTGAAPITGLVPGGPMASSGGNERDRRSHRPVADWPMPAGVPPVIVAPPDVPVWHDPGPGVIGIDR